MTHGWPSSFLEMLDLLPLLTDWAGRYVRRGRPVDARLRLLPPPVADGHTPLPIADMWCELMVDVLGYDRFVAHGGDIGAGVTVALARRHAEHVLGIHLTTDWADDTLARRSPHAEDLDYLRKVRVWEREESAYGDIQGTKPQTLAAASTTRPLDWPPGSSRSGAPGATGAGPTTACSVPSSCCRR